MHLSTTFNQSLGAISPSEGLNESTAKILFSLLTSGFVEIQKDTAMLRDDSSSGPSRRRTPRNVLGEPLEACSIKPMTGFYRDGCCNTGREDIGSHTVCVVMTSAFLDFSKSHGNDLSTPVPQFDFPGLKPGDRWCLYDFLDAGCAAERETYRIALMPY